MLFGYRLKESLRRFNQQISDKLSKIDIKSSQKKMTAVIMSALVEGSPRLLVQLIQGHARRSVFAVQPSVIRCTYYFTNDQLHDKVGDLFVEGVAESKAQSSQSIVPHVVVSEIPSMSADGEYKLNVISPDKSSSGVHPYASLHPTAHLVITQRTMNVEQLDIKMSAPSRHTLSMETEVSSAGDVTVVQDASYEYDEISGSCLYRRKCDNLLTYFTSMCILSDSSLVHQ